jgi:nucleoid-associated protein YgaU
MESGDKPADTASADPAAMPPASGDATASAAPAGDVKAPDDIPLAPPADGAAAPVADASPAPSSPELAQNSAPAPAPDPAPAAAAEVAPTPSAVSDSSSGDSTYTVHQGDTLMKIAFETCGDLYKWKEIFEANQDQIKNPNLILPGTVLKISHSDSAVAHNGEKREIKPGETLGTISNDVYGTPRKWKKLWANNRDLIKDPNRIFAGFFIYYTVSPEDEQELKNAPAPLADQQPNEQQPAAPQAAAAPATPASVPAAAAAPDTRSPASVKTAAPQTGAAAQAPAVMQMTPLTSGH